MKLNPKEKKMPSTYKKHLKESRTWDYNLDFKETYKRLNDQIILSRKDLNSGNITTNRVKKFTCLIIGLIQLRNGSRIGEAIEATNNFCSDFNVKLTLARIQKRGESDPGERKMVRPDEITKEDLEYIQSYVFSRTDERKDFVISLTNFFKKNFGFTTHSLRYSWIGYMASIKTPAQVIAKITGHKTLNHILHYTNKSLGEIALLSMSPLD